ncbi:beta-ketoacyl synthase N-terminal-like domain-containing protein [Oceanobacillus kimchii]|uniref:beta-ketoacyl synthase N-terminal-like domain-containing protein n=1 Tax=Oceanobacillus kimchii TaxID=746691 RepID=UPI003B02476C
MIDEINKSKYLDNSNEIAIIGIGLRFPHSESVLEFWDNLSKGRDLISHLPISGMSYDIDSLSEEEKERLVLRYGYLDNIEYFDPSFFNMNKKQAEQLDPQQRLFLMCAWEAIEDAGYNIDEIKSSTSIYAGASESGYSKITPKALDGMSQFQSEMSTMNKFIATRTSYTLNLKGESMLIDTACSTSLSAVYLASQSLLNGSSDYAIAGASCVQVNQGNGYIYEPNFILSPDGICRPFDANARGTVFGNGVGVVLLKRANDAIKDKDPIYAIIRGMGMNNDGNSKLGFTAPSYEGVSKVITKTHNDFNIDPNTISYIEAHGTGTYLGDPLEVAVYNKLQKNSKQKCAIGSVKSNIGHTDSVAGVAGLIKTALCLKHKRLVPTIHYNEPNPECNFDKGNLFVNTENIRWISKVGPLRASVTSLGIGGTNVYMILEEAPE